MNAGEEMKYPRYRVVITDCDHGSVKKEKEEFGRMGAELNLAQVRKEEDLIRVCKEADGLIRRRNLPILKIPCS